MRAQLSKLLRIHVTAGPKSQEIFFFCSFYIPDEIPTRGDPRHQIHGVIGSTAYPDGVGEAGTLPIAPAATNAVVAATGKRVRPLRLIDQGFTVPLPVARRSAPARAAA